jgi:NTE family protein
MNKGQKQKVALVLSGGAARGLAHIGVIEELESRGYEISSIAGTSMGALIGGVYATGRLGELTKYVYTLDKTRMFRMIDFTLSKQGLIKGDRVLNKMKEFVPDMLIEDLRLPYAAVAVDLIHREEVVFRSGSLYHAIRASISIPSIFTPVKEGNRLLVDGGLVNNLPMAHVDRREGDLMVAVHVNANIPGVKPEDGEEVENQALNQNKIRELFKHIHPSSSKDEEKLGYLTLITRSFELMIMRMAEEKIRQFSPEVLINVPFNSCNLYDFYRAQEQVETGRRAAAEVLDSLKIAGNHA